MCNCYSFLVNSNYLSGETLSVKGYRPDGHSGILFQNGIANGEWLECEWTNDDYLEVRSWKRGATERNMIEDEIRKVFKTRGGLAKFLYPKGKVKFQSGSWLVFGKKHNIIEYYDIATNNSQCKFLFVGKMKNGKKIGRHSQCYENYKNKRKNYEIIEYYAKNRTVPQSIYGVTKRITKHNGIVLESVTYCKKYSIVRKYDKFGKIALMKKCFYDWQQPIITKYDKSGNIISVKRG